MSDKEDKISKSIEELFDAYPEVDPDAIPDTVWRSVADGGSLKEAYARYLIDKDSLGGVAERVNGKNRRESSGKISLGGKNGFFTAKQVACMTDKEVRENYIAIVESMEQGGFFD